MPFNAVHGSWDRDAARGELVPLFPGFKFSGGVLQSPLGKSPRQVWALLNVQ